MNTTAAMIGLSLIGQASNSSNPNRFTAIAMILSTNHDSDMANGYAFILEKAPDSTEVQKAVEQVKDFFRRMITGIIHQAEAQSLYLKQEEMKKVLEKLKDSNKPSDLGTVNGISRRYNISKSEVRRRKADGTLEEYVNTL